MKKLTSLARSQVFKFAIVGLICAAFEYLSFFLLITFLELNYYLANIISVVLAISLNYLLSRMYVFEKSKFSRSQEIFAFAAFSALGILLNQALLYFFVAIIMINVNIGKAFAIALVAFFNYVTKKYIVFRR